MGIWDSIGAFDSVALGIGLGVTSLVVLGVFSVLTRRLRYAGALLLGGVTAGLVATDGGPLEVVGGIFLLYSLPLVVCFRFGPELDGLRTQLADRLIDRETTGFEYNDTVFELVFLLAFAVCLLLISATGGLADGVAYLSGVGLVMFGFAMGVWAVAILFATPPSD